MAQAPTQHDVCVVGGGIVGLTAAALLAKQGLSIVVVEQAAVPKSKPKDRAYDLRVSAINLASMAIFEHLGIAESIRDERASAYHQMQIWDANSDASIQFDADDIDREELGYIIENNIIIIMLYNFLKGLNNVVFIHGNGIDALNSLAKGVDIHAGGESFSAKLLIGADGQYSKVRELAQLPTEMGVFNQTALVCRIQTQFPHAQTAYQCFHQTGPIAYLPLADGSCSIVWSCDSDYATELRQLDDDAFANVVECALQSKLGTVKILGPRAGFELAQQHASRYIDPGIALIGDAAHRTHPLAGLGANLGLQDAAVLAEVIQTARRQNRAFNHVSTLRQYERNRQPQNAMILDAMQAFKTGFGSPSPGIRSLRGFALDSANQFTPLRAFITQLATGISGDLPQICKPQI